MTATNQTEGNGWAEWKRKVLSDISTLSARLDNSIEKLATACTDIAVLNDLRTDVQSLKTSVDNLREDVAVIKTKLATYGAVSGAIAGITVAVITALTMRAFGL